MKTTSNSYLEMYESLLSFNLRFKKGYLEKYIILCARGPKSTIRLHNMYRLLNPQKRICQKIK